MTVDRGFEASDAPEAEAGRSAEGPPALAADRPDVSGRTAVEAEPDSATLEGKERPVIPAGGAGPAAEGRTPIAAGDSESRTPIAAGGGNTEGRTLVAAGGGNTEGRTLVAAGGGDEAPGTERAGVEAPRSLASFAGRDVELSPGGVGSSGESQAQDAAVERPDAAGGPVASQAASAEAFTPERPVTDDAADGTQEGGSSPALLTQFWSAVAEVGAAERAKDAADARDAVPRFWSAVDDVGRAERAKALADDAVDRLVREQGPRLAELVSKIDDLRRSGFAEQQAHRIRALEQERDAIVEAYDPSVQRSSVGVFVELPVVPPYMTRVVPLAGPPTLDGLDQIARREHAKVYAPEIFPEDSESFGSFGGRDLRASPEWLPESVRVSVEDAYTFEVDVNKYQVADALERLARMGPSEIHVGTGVHGRAAGAMSDSRFEIKRSDAFSASETMERHPGLQIVQYDLGDPVEAAKFDQLQKLASEGRLSGGCTLAAFCFSASRLPDASERSGGPYATTEVTDPTPLGGAYAHGALSVAFGALSVYEGRRDPNDAVGALKTVAGGAEALGGVAYVSGYALGLDDAVRLGSTAATVSRYAAGPLTVVDIYRNAVSTFGSGEQVGAGEAAYFGFDSALKLAGVFYWQAAAASLAINLGMDYGVKPVVRDIAPTVMVRGISAVTGVPEGHLWGWH